MHEDKTTPATRRPKLHRCRIVWLSMALSHLACSHLCETRQQPTRMRFHRDEALHLLEKIGLNNLQVKPFAWAGHDEPVGFYTVAELVGLGAAGPVGFYTVEQLDRLAAPCRQRGLGSSENDRKGTA